MQMIDLMKRLAELDAKNPNMEQGVAEGSKHASRPGTQARPGSATQAQAGVDRKREHKAELASKLAQQAAEKNKTSESLEEYGMMGGMSQPNSPASINMTAATGEELSGMLRDIMQLAGRPMQEPTGGEEPMGDMEPMSSADGVAVVDVEPSPEVGSDEPSIMRSMIDKLNPDDEMGDDEMGDDDEEKTDEMYDNSPNEQIAGYDAAVPNGNDLHKQKQQFPATARGDNPMAVTFEGLMAEYRKFISEGSKEAHEQNMDAAQREMDSREAEGEDMSNYVIDPKTYKIVKKK
jgi:hypothetical protein